MPSRWRLCRACPELRSEGNRYCSLVLLAAYYTVWSMEVMSRFPIGEPHQAGTVRLLQYCWLLTLIVLILAGGYLTIVLNQL